VIDLHHHFDGAFETEALMREARRRKLPQGKLSDADFKKNCQVPPGCKTLTEFLNVFNFFYDIAQDLDFLHGQAESLGRRAAEGGAIYLETRFGPHLFKGEKYSAAQVTESVLSGLEKNQSTRVRLILCVMRNSPIEQVAELIDLYETFHERGVCGIDLAGDESQYACTEYAPVFDRAHALGIPITIHAGEAAGPQSVKNALNLFHARRIGHGIRSIEDSELVKRLAAERIGVEVCLTSNLQTGNALSYQEHPFMRLREAGVLVTLNTDDPSVSGIDLNHEWATARREYALSSGAEKEILLNAAAVAFCNEAMRNNLKRQIENKFAS